MELTLQLFDWQRYKRIVLIFFIVLFGLLLPSIAIADEIGGYDTEKLIGIAGAADSNLVIGRGGSNNTYLDIAMGGSHLSPTDPAYQIVSLAPLLYAALLLFVLIGLLVHMSFKNIIIGVVAIYVASALLQGMNISILNLLR